MPVTSKLTNTMLVNTDETTPQFDDLNTKLVDPNHMPNFVVVTGEIPVAFSDSAAHVENIQN